MVTATDKVPKPSAMISKTSRMRRNRFMAGTFYTVGEACGADESVAAVMTAPIHLGHCAQPLNPLLQANS